MYGMPQPNQYGQYGFGGWGGAAGAPGAGTPGMPQPQGAGDMTGIGQGTLDPTAVAGQAAGQWGNAADPNSYYSNYWGGKSINHSHQQR
jgi:nucleolysin TIA-1/TIAR